MPQLLLPGFPVGATTINETCSMYIQDGHCCWLMGQREVFRHTQEDRASYKTIVSALMKSGRVRPCEFERSPLKLNHRTLMNWSKQYQAHGASAFRGVQRRQPAEKVMTSLNLRAQQAGFTDLMLNEATLNHRMVEYKLNELVSMSQADRNASLAAAAGEVSMPTPPMPLAGPQPCSGHPGPRIAQRSSYSLPDMVVWPGSPFYVLGMAIWLAGDLGRVIGVEVGMEGPGGWCRGGWSREAG